MDPDPGQSTICDNGAGAGCDDLGRLAVEIVRRDGAWPRDSAEEALIVAAARAAFASAEHPRGRAELAVVLTGDDEMRALNRAWRGHDAPTNVLSFPLDLPAGGPTPHPLGDVVLAFETVAREAEAHALPRAWHAAHLAVHGILHLLGHAHGSDRAAAAMESLETRVLTGLGLHDPYKKEVDFAVAGERSRGATP